MRIAIVGPTYPFKGGVAQHTTELAHRLTAAGHDTQIVSWRRQYPRWLYPGQLEIDQPELAKFSPTHRQLSWDRPDTWIKAGRQLRAVDMVIVAHVTPVQVIPHLVLITALRRQTPTLVVCHNVMPHEPGPADRFLVPRLLRSANGVLVHTDQQATLARGLTARPVRVAHLAPFMPEGFVRSNPRPGVHRRLLFFGLVRPYKGLDVLLRALALGPSDVRLRVAGEFWEDQAESQRLCEDLGIAERVELIPGYVASDEVPALFADVDALVLPYRDATGSQGVWSGFEFGVPVIATRAGALADGVREGVDGFIAEPGDVESLAGVLRCFYQPGVPERLRANVRPVDGDALWAQYVSTLAELATDITINEQSVSRAPE